MHRLFVAVPLPDPAIQQILALMGGISGARWQTRDQIHLTLRFVGEVDRHQAAEIDSALAAVRHPRFELALNGLGAFQRRGQHEVVWAGLAPQEPLKALHMKVDQAIVRTGLKPERRAYSPHITLARLKRNSGPIGGFLEQPGARGDQFTVDAFCLYESRLSPEGAVYSTVERYSLG